MPSMQFFYDYECPYCVEGYGFLLKQMEKHPEIEVEYIPVEAHPRPEEHLPHTDLCVQAFYVARELDADLPSFHDAMFQAIGVERVDAEDVQVLCDAVQGIVDARRFKEVLMSGKYSRQVESNNDLAYEQQGVWAVPAFRMDGRRLDAVEGVGITQQQLEEFLGFE